MHFWIDKRSQQCGFGRSRVAASLSHAGGGLSYGHPPRRSKSSSNSGSSNIAASSSSNSSVTHNQSLASVHRTLGPYGGDFPTGAGTSRQASHYTSSNNNAHASSQQLLHHSSNNNNSNGSSSSNAVMSTATASNNNNANATASSAAVLTGSGTIVPLVARGSHYHQHSTRYQPRPQHQQHHQQHQQQLQQHQLQQQQHHYSYNYHHPQFGNMAVPVRQYESQQQQQHQQHQQHAGVYADDAYSAYHHHHSSSNNSGSNTNNSRYVTPRRHNSSNNMRHTTATVAAAAAIAATTTTSTTTATAQASATPIPPTQTQTTTGHSNQLQQQHHALLQHADSQLLPSHLKCGMCASLVLASVFVAGAKFYFDHQGTGLEVLIFCAFSATFFLAACMVSLCRIPKGLLPSRSNGRAVCHSRGVNASGSGGGCMLELNDVRYLDERQVEISAATAAAAAAGPPPYHIAILLPEQTPTALGKQLPLDESPPPSYDKILV